VKTLFLEYEDVVGRPSIVERSPLTESEIGELLDAFASVCTWVRVYYRWRPSLIDEADHHLLELAVAASAGAIVTKNVRHFIGGELRFPQIRILRPEEIIKEL
jgi:predicted nucleic acid-binding protein